MTYMIQVLSNFHGARAFITHTRPDEIPAFLGMFGPVQEGAITSSNHLRSLLADIWERFRLRSPATDKIVPVEERCTPKQRLRGERLKAKVEPLLNLSHNGLPESFR